MTAVAVAGGGLIGLSVAWRAAQRGLTVTVVDDAPGTGASHAAAGMLAPVTEAGYGEEALLQLCLASLERWPAFAADVEAAGGVPVGLRTAGTLVVGFDDDDMRALDALHAFQRELGLAADRLTPRATRRREPSLTPRVRGGLLVPGDQSVDGRSLHAGLLAAARAAGVRLVERRVAGVHVEGGRAAGLLLPSGEVLAADAVVLALGAHSAGLPGVPPLPVRPVKGQILRLAGAADLLRGTVRALVRGRQVYLVPYAGDRLVVGATVEDRGFDATVTAGGVHELLHDAIDVVPEVGELELVETLARWRPGTADNAPLLGPSGLPGLALATGHHRNGVLLAPVTGEILADYLSRGQLPELAAPFTADRFPTDHPPTDPSGSR
ncbi:glycine oxidase ThiO [Blastococcus xanthinilyticus]|uniref:glycine oxidase n=1 Tax=Blastococcus xanthinilyticus TaxID=1564164 RepID=A0A5S5CRM3_9ACTN|nr:glycine oxidase ThiO [Blastococcus xanthinilyticus]TYP86531.1 glycine oxidase [Blastococcus xanthinilyticus]